MYALWGSKEMFFEKRKNREKTGGTQYSIYLLPKNQKVKETEAGVLITWVLTDPETNSTTK